MAKKITKREKQIIIDTIIGWSDSSITWEEVCDECQTILNHRPSRQTLSYHKEIIEAFKSKKNGIKNGKNMLKKPSSLSIAADTIFRLESDCYRLEQENKALKQQFVFWQFNAYKYGITEQQLNEPLPPVDRGRTDRKLI